MDYPGVVVPARIASTRFPGKVLKDLNGKPVLWWVARAARMAFPTVVATPDTEIIQKASTWKWTKNKLSTMVTKTGFHDTLIDRCSEAISIAANTFDPVIILQGDEPMLTTEMVKDAYRYYKKYGNLCFVSPITEEESLDPNTVKVVLGKDRKIWYASRYPVPGKTPEGDGEYMLQRYKQVCVMAFSRADLLNYRGWPREGVERSEGIDILRFLANDVKITAINCYARTHAVDTPEDLELVSKLMKEQGYV